MKRSDGHVLVLERSTVFTDNVQQFPNRVREGLEELQEEVGITIHTAIYQENEAKCVHGGELNDGGLKLF